MIEQLNTDPNLTPQQRQMLRHDIMQKGFIDGTGNPIFYVIPDNTPQGDCVPDGPNPRDHPASGSTAAVSSGQDASFFQPIGVISEYSSIPDQEGVLYVTVHNQTESSAGAALDKMAMGATITHSVDGRVRHYQLVKKNRVYGQVSMPDLIAMLNEEAKGVKRIIFQTCIDDDESKRALFYFDEIEA